MNKIKTRKEFQEQLPAGIIGWLRKNKPELLEQYLPSTLTKWTLEKCKKEALKYKLVSHWEKGNPNSYAAARRNNWVKMCNKHMKNNDNKIRSKRVINIDTGTIFPSINAATRKYSGVYKVLVGQRKSAGGYRWAYCDEKGNIIK